MSEIWDVIVVGAGTAGLPTAIHAGQRGAKVLVVEVSDRVGGTLHLSSGSFSAAGTSLQRSKNIDDSPEKHFNDGLRINHGTGNKTMMRLWQDHAAAAYEWLMSIGMQYPDNQPEAVRGHEPYDTPRIYTPVNAGVGYIAPLKNAFEAEVAKGNVKLLLKTEMTDLIIDPAKGVQGVKVKSADGKIEDIHGRNVVLAAGGYANNEAMWREIHNRPRRVYTNAQSMGTGIQVARKYGAQLEGAEEIIMTFGGTQCLDDPSKVWIHAKTQPSMRDPWEIYVNLKGERFMAEDERNPDVRERALMLQDDWACWCIYDQSIVDKSPSPFFLWEPEKVARAFATNPNYRKANTLDELATLTGLPAKALKETVKRYNDGQAVGADAFDRKFMPAPITTGPFYAVKLYSITVVSFAGVTVDTNLRILDAAKKPIPNLYAVGEMLGMGIFGNAYLGGSSVSGAITLGRLLGNKLLSWSQTGALAAE
ncbi:MAG: FAD-dependent oxidoreductase [Rhodospirillaceae bacterium]|nr:FAD-dependent oxidoreductase [Rhodospirillaceae bacterium]